MVVYIKLNLASWFIYFLSTPENSSKRSQRIKLVLSLISSRLRITRIIWSETSQTRWYKQCTVLEYVSNPALPILTSTCLRKKDRLCVSDCGWEWASRDETDREWWWCTGKKGGGDLLKESRSFFELAFLCERFCLKRFIYFSSRNGKWRVIWRAPAELHWKLLSPRSLPGLFVPSLGRLDLKEGTVARRLSS